jgi:hypothetical protein
MATIAADRHLLFGVDPTATLVANSAEASETRGDLFA